MFKKILASFIAVCMFIIVFCPLFITSAAVINKSEIIISTVSAKPGDKEVIVPIEMNENPGIMALTLSITYDSNVLEYVGYSKGKVVNDYMLKAHPDKNVIRFVSGMFSESKESGLLIKLKFNVKSDAKVGTSKVNIECSKGDICNEKLDNIMPSITSGGVKVEYNGSNCSHTKYGRWTVEKEATCEKSGLKTRVCSTCGYKEEVKIKALGHEFPDEWTVDREATKTQSGLMSRHCKKCDKKVDSITFTLEQSEEGNIENTEGSKTPVNDYTEGIFKEQNPDKELTENNPSVEDVPEENETQTDPQTKVQSIFEKINAHFPNFSKIIKIAIISLILLLKI